MSITIKAKELAYHALFNRWITAPLFATLNLVNLTRVKFKARIGKPVRVLFVAMSVPMWHYQGIYEWLKSDTRFEVYIVLSPTVLWGKSEMIENLIAMRRYFDEHDMAFIDWRLEDDYQPCDIRKAINPDIIFYTQPYDKVHVKSHRFNKFLDKLLCYCAYGMTAETYDWNYNLPFHNIAWRLYYPLKRDMENASQLSYLKGLNMRVVGYSNQQLFERPATCNPWKDCGKRLKRIVWAPHYSIRPNDPLHLDSFIWSHDTMRQIAKKYHQVIQIAFKPHPKLKSQLYELAEWGIERTNAYYDWWESQPNTQLETGEFIDLFKTSDAYIGDSGSFRTEYLYVHKPSMFLTRDVDKLMASSNDYLKKVYSVLYLGSNKDDIIHFIDESVILGKDPMKDLRETFYQEEMLPPNGSDVGKNIYNDICQSLGITPDNS
ncbi:MAG: hypothetical protein IJ724_13640 [Muribaculaceae bacterium]|nr:hypothetical protein [Muribaculaceae bacterium]MBR1727657.1 hypothetical protein [Muribaculaceae bacterium]